MLFTTMSCIMGTSIDGYKPFWLPACFVRINSLSLSVSLSPSLSVYVWTILADFDFNCVFCVIHSGLFVYCNLYLRQQIFLIYWQINQKYLLSF